MTTSTSADSTTDSTITATTTVPTTETAAAPTASDVSAQQATANAVEVEAEPEPIATADVSASTAVTAATSAPPTNAAEDETVAVESAAVIADVAEAEAEAEAAAPSNATADATVVTCSQIRVKAVPVTTVDPEVHFEVVHNIALPALKENELLIEAEYLSVDPYMRGRLIRWFHQRPNRMGQGFQTALVLESKSAKYKVGDHVYGVFPMASKSVITDSMVRTSVPPNLRGYTDANTKNENENENQNGNESEDENEAAAAKQTTDDTDEKASASADANTNANENQNSQSPAFEVSQLAEIPHSYYIGSYGMPGMTAYYGLVGRAQLQRNESVFVSGAAGAVGSVVGQMAKQLYDCRVVGCAGTKTKIDWLTNDLQFDGALNYKAFNGNYEQFQAALKIQFPKGIDVYFDNVGGFISEAVWDVLNPGARVIICGQIAIYNDDPANPTLVRPFLAKLIYREIDVRGLYVANFKDHPRFYYDIGKMICEGKMKVKETMVDGFENTPQAFCGLFTGQNIGKMVVRCKPEQK